MAYYVVIDEDGQKHIPWAANEDEAWSLIARTRSVRVATVRDIEQAEAIHSDEPHNPRGAEEEVAPSDNQ